ERDPRAAVHADQLVRAGDRPRAVPVGAHGPDAHTPPVRQARRARPHRGGRARPRPRPARATPIPPRVLSLTGTRQLRPELGAGPAVEPERTLSGFWEVRRVLTG